MATSPEVTPSDPSAEQADENAGFTYDPGTGEMVPGDSAYAQELNTVNPETDPGLQNEDGAAEGGNTAADFLNTPPVVPNTDGAAEGGNTVGNAANTTNEPFLGTITSATKREPKPPAAKDWRVRISLAPGANYLYNYGDATKKEAGILEPLRKTGVIFPYTPSIAVAYNAKYDPTSITHSNYNMYNYSGSSVDQITITGDFTAQDTTEAEYMLAVIHFFRSATKMFYGQDENPKRGTPPPLLYLSGHGNYQFDNHPMVLTNFSYALPTDVDYINAYPNGAGALNTMPLAPYNRPNTAKPSPMQRLLGSGLQPGGTGKKPIFVNSPSGVEVVTRVPTRISISLTFLPVVTRNAITNQFSLKKYASGELLRGSKNPGTGGGIW